MIYYVLHKWKITPKKKKKNYEIEYPKKIKSWEVHGKVSRYHLSWKHKGVVNKLRLTAYP